MGVMNRYVTNVDGTPKESDLELKTNEVIVKNLYVSIDPYQMNRMKSYSSSQKHSNFGEAIDTYGVGKVGGSTNPEFEKDDIVAGLLNWGEYTLIKAGVMLNKPFIIQVSLLKEKLGFDDAFNYREETDLKSTLKRYFPDGIDIYFDNVGVEMQAAAIYNMNTNGRIAVCGVIAEYTDDEKTELHQISFQQILNTFVPVKFSHWKISQMGLRVSPLLLSGPKHWEENS
ncbi:hypothetical protein PTKIN_Ptkin19aG0046100 [Pterospermum kingtungense]